MKFPEKYLILTKNKFNHREFALVPIRYEDRLDIMKWRNEQIYHLRQSEPLTEDGQDKYFKSVVASLFKQLKPNQILFSFLKKNVCIGYGGLVHINWVDKNAEISFVMDTELEKTHFQKHWTTFLGLLEKVAFQELRMHKIYTYAFDLRPKLYIALESIGFTEEAVLREHCLYSEEYRDVVIHSKWDQQENISLRKASKEDAVLYFEWANDVSVRRNAIQSGPIPWEMHIKWFKSKLATPERSKLFVLQSNNKPIGQIRFDLNEQNEWIIDYSISLDYRGKDLGKKIVTMGLNELSTGSKVRAAVKSKNIPSLKVFEGLGFNKHSERVHDIDYLVFKLTKK